MRSRSTRPRRLTKWLVAIIANDGVVGFLPWPANRQWSWEKSVVRHHHLQKSARKRRPSRDTADTSSDSQGRTFYYVKRQLETQSRAREREHRFYRSRRGLRVVHYASCTAPRQCSAPFGYCRCNFDKFRSDSTAASRIDRLQLKPTAFTHDSPEWCEGSFLRIVINQCKSIRFCIKSNSRFRNCSVTTIKIKLWKSGHLTSEC